MKADMREQLAVKSRFPLTGLRWAVAGALAMALAAGCHRAETSGDAEPKANEKVASTASSKPAVPTINPSDLFPDDKAGSGQSADDKGPPPKFVKIKEVTAVFPDKTPQSTWTLKVYSDGTEIKDGPYNEFYFNGKKLMEGQYVAGLKQGEWKYWGTNGKLIKTETYRNGKLDGAWTLLHEDGSKERDESWKAGKRDGKWILYDSAGKNKPVEQNEFKDGARDGTWIRWNPDGTKASEEHYANAKIDGEQTRWYPNGKTQETQTFKNGVPNGKRIRWKENGEKLSETVFKNGQPIETKASSEK